ATGAHPGRSVDVGQGTDVGNRRVEAEAAAGGDTASLGAGAIITVLSTGMKFTSPARAFPTETPMTVSEDHYWRGYREGRGDQRQQLTDREHDLQRQEDTIFAAEDHLKQMAEALLGHSTAS
uniref:hypothetical protein n=1 Tax=Galactobacter sp. TaxID=2676125 RepID=UPI0025B8DC9B